MLRLDSTAYEQALQMEQAGQGVVLAALGVPPRQWAPPPSAPALHPVAADGDNEFCPISDLEECEEEPTLHPVAADGDNQFCPVSDLEECEDEHCSEAALDEVKSTLKDGEVTVGSSTDIAGEVTDSGLQHPVSSSTDEGPARECSLALAAARSPTPARRLLAPVTRMQSARAPWRAPGAAALVARMQSARARARSRTPPAPGAGGRDGRDGRDGPPTPAASAVTPLDGRDGRDH